MQPCFIFNAAEKVLQLIAIEPGQAPQSWAALISPGVSKSMGVVPSPSARHVDVSKPGKAGPSSDRMVASSQERAKDICC